MNPLTTARFWAKIKKHENGCWLWTGSKRCKGYGAFVWADESGKIVQGRAHRFSWEIHNEKIPAGMFCLHRCDTPACCNPDHLFLGTNDDNIRDMLRKGRHVSGGTHTPVEKCKYKKGEFHHNSKVNGPDIIEIRRLNKIGQSHSQIATLYGLGVTAVHRIVTRKSWKHVE